MKTPHIEQILYHNLKEKALYNHKNQTFAEKLFWNLLRNNNFGVKFRRQHIIDIYIVDFICLKYSIILEIDGSSHENKIEYDNIRTNHLENLGFQVFRFRNKDIIVRSNWVELKIKEIIGTRLKKPLPDPPQIKDLGRE